MCTTKLMKPSRLKRKFCNSLVLKKEFGKNEIIEIKE